MLATPPTSENGNIVIHHILTLIAELPKGIQKTKI